MNIEDDLRAALRREPAPADFAARVLAQTTPAQTRVLPFRRRPVGLAIAAALVAAAVVPSAWEYRSRRRAHEAKDQLILALSITRTQLQQVREKVRQNTRRRI
jgi:negative regulator of sigma E activity